MIGIYCRISKDGEEKRSIEYQEAEGIKFAKSLNKKYKIYTDKGISGGKKRNERPELNKLLSDIEEGLIDSIYIYNQDRAAREETVWFEIASIVKEYEVSLYENGVLLDLNESSTFTMRGIKAIFDAEERRKTSKRFKDILRRNAEQGRRFSFVQFGYQEGEDKKLEINPEQAEIVKRIFALSLDGKGVAKIAEILNEENIPTIYNNIDGTYKVKNRYTLEISIKNKSDVKWRGGTIRGILTNPIYKGERRWNNTTYPAPKILEEWYWQKVNDNFKNNNNNKGQKVLHSYLLKGLLRCGKCGANYYGRTRVTTEGKKPKDNYYMCSSKRRGEQNCGNRSISIDAIDTVIWHHLFFDGKMREILQLHFSNNIFETTLEVINNKIEDGINQINKIDIQRQKIIDAIGNDVISYDDARTNIENLKAEKKKIENLLNEIENKQTELLKDYHSKNERINILNNIQNLGIDERRELLKKYIKNIIIINDYYSIFPESPYPKLNFNKLPEWAKKGLKNNTDCFVIIQFNIFGLKDEVYCILSNRKEVVNYPSYESVFVGKKEKIRYFNLTEWQETMKFN
jgi:site-specific DNA recombinase